MGGDGESGQDATLTAPADPHRPQLRVALPEEGVHGAGRYVLRDEHGRGGLGRVFKAFDRQLGREVAVKELLHSGHVLEARFLREAYITSRLEHPGIVPVHELARWDDGRPFYAMKLVSGRSLRDVIRDARALEDRLALIPHVIAVADAVAYAHSRGIVHRDLKPSNVMVGEYGETVVVDWGLAKDISVDEDAEALPAGPYRATGGPELTAAGAIVGTPAYMPPEQAAGEDVGIEADVYAVGAILYHTIVGRPPYEGTDSSRVLEQVRAESPRPVRELEASAPAELAAIVDRAMARKPGDRYASAGELAADLRRLQSGHLVQAHRYSAGELLGRWLHRYRLPLAVAVAAAVGLAAFGTYSLVRVRGERDRASAARRATEAERNRLTLLQAEAAAEREPAAAVAWLRGLGDTATVADWRLARLTASTARRGFVPRAIVPAHQNLVTAIAMSPDGRAMATSSYDATVRVWNMVDGSSYRIDGFSDWTLEVVFSPDGRHLAIGSQIGEVRLWDLEARAVRGDWRQPYQITGLAFSADGRRLIATSDSTVAQPSPTVKVIDVASASELWSSSTESVSSLVVLADGERFVTGTRLGYLRVWSVRDGSSEVLIGHGGDIADLAVVPGAERVASIASDGSVRIWDLDAGTSIALRGAEAALMEVQVSPDGRWVAAGDESGAVHLWSAADGTYRVGRADDSGAGMLAFSPDSATLAVGHADGLVALWSLEDDTWLRMPGDFEVPYALRFSHDGRWLLAGCLDHTVRVWDLNAAPRDRSYGPSGNRVVAAAPAEPLVFLAGNRGAAIWNTATGERRELELPPPTVLYAARWAAGGGQVVAGSLLGKTHLWDVRSGEHRALVCTGKPVMSADLTPDGALVVAGEMRSGVVCVWRPDGSDEATQFTGHTSGVTSVVVSRDGALVATGDMEGSVRLWRLNGGEPVVFDDHQGHGTEGMIWDVALSPDAAIVASSGGDRTIRLRDTATGAPLHVLRGHTGPALDIAFSPDGAWLASAGDDRTVRLWDVRTGEARVLDGHRFSVQRVAFSQDGSKLATGSLDETLRIWDLHTGGSRSVPGRTKRTDLAFGPDAQYVAYLTLDGRAGIAYDDLPEEPSELARWLDGVTSAALTDRDKVRSPDSLQLDIGRPLVSAPLGRIELREEPPVERRSLAPRDWQGVTGNRLCLDAATPASIELPAASLRGRAVRLTATAVASHELSEPDARLTARITAVSADGEPLQNTPGSTPLTTGDWPIAVATELRISTPAATLTVTLTSNSATEVCVKDTELEIY